MVEFSSQVLRVFIVTKVKEITEASASVGLLLATAVLRVNLKNKMLSVSERTQQPTRKTVFQFSKRNKYLEFQSYAQLRIRKQRDSANVFKFLSPPNSDNVLIHLEGYRVSTLP